MKYKLREFTIEEAKKLAEQGCTYEDIEMMMIRAIADFIYYNLPEDELRKAKADPDRYCDALMQQLTERKDEFTDSFLFDYYADMR